MRNLPRPAHGQKPFRGQRALKRDLYYLQKYKNTKKHYTQIKRCTKCRNTKNQPIQRSKSSGEKPLLQQLPLFLVCKLAKKSQMQL